MTIARFAFMPDIVSLRDAVDPRTIKVNATNGSSN